MLALLRDRRCQVALLVALAHAGAIWLLQQEGSSQGSSETVVSAELVSEFIAPPTPTVAAQPQSAPKPQPRPSQPQTPQQVQPTTPLDDAPSELVQEAPQPETPQSESTPIETPTVAQESAAPPPAQRTQGVSTDPSPWPSNRSPAYPRASQERNEQGSGVISLRIDAKGRVIEAKISVSSGYVLLDRAALNTFRRWRFKPGLVDGQPAETLVDQPFDFKLDGE